MVSGLIAPLLDWGDDEDDTPTGSVEFETRIEEQEDLQAVVNQAYQGALADAYPDASEEGDFPFGLTIRTELTFEEVA